MSEPDPAPLTGLCVATVTAPHAPTDALIATFRDGFGEESVALAAFTVTGGRLPDCILSHTLEGSRFDLSPLLLSDALRQAAPALARLVDPDRLFCFELLSPLLLSAAVAEALVAGGPAPASRVKTSAAHQLVSAWVDALIGDRYDDIVILHSRTAWSSWFGCEVWDRTWIVADCAVGRVWLLCLTGDTAPWLPRQR